MNMRRIALSLAVLSAILVLIALPVSTAPVVAQEAAPHFEWVECRPEITSVAPVPVECGVMTVLENRSNPDSRTIQFPVYLVRSSGDNPAPDPLVYLEGGPGAGGSRLLPYFNYLFASYVMERDIILFDQRGTGFANPSLQCEAYNVANFEAYASPLGVEEAAQQAADALIGCYNDFLAQGIDMNAYTSAASAADLEELRVAMGYAEWNLYGISYGTRLALTAMRDFPDGIRSVVIDSVVPVQADLYPATPASGAGAIDRLFDLCTADARCNSTYPDLERVFYETVDRLNATPEQIDVYRSTDGQYYAAELDGNVLVGLLFFNLYSTSAIRSLPYMIYSAYVGDYDPLIELASNYFAWDDIATGMHYALNCSEEIIFNTPEEVRNASAELDPRLAPFFDLDNLVTLDICDAWNEGAANPIEDQPVVSDIPTLVLSGELDPITPPSWGAMAAETLSHHFRFVVPGGGHGVSFSYACVTRIMRNFLENPLVEPASACLNDIDGPAFEIIPVDTGG